MLHIQKQSYLLFTEFILFKNLISSILIIYIRINRITLSEIYNKYLFDYKNQKLILEDCPIFRMSQKSSKEQFKQQSANQRQFRCKCSKNYKSYPALYTHMKNKHAEKLQQFKRDSQRPRDQEKKGRPPKVHRARPREANEQGELLNIIQLGILQIQNLLNGSKYDEVGEQKFGIFVGNQKLDFQELKKYYNLEKQKINQIIFKLYSHHQSHAFMEVFNKKKLTTLVEQVPVNIYKESIRFKNQLVQHFNQITAAKILLNLQLIEVGNEVENQKVFNEFESQIINNSEIMFNTDLNSLLKSCEQSLWGLNQAISLSLNRIHEEWHNKTRHIDKRPSINDHENLFDEFNVEEESLGLSQAQEKEQDQNFEEIMECIDCKQNDES